MPVTEAVVQAFLSNLIGVRPITSRKMFGGIGIYYEGTFFAVIDNDRLYFKVDDSNRADYLEAGMEQWAIEGPKGGAMPYFEIPDGVLGNRESLGDWIDKAVEVAQRKKRK